MKTLLLASALAAGLAMPAFAQSTDLNAPAQSGSDAVNDATILPGGGGAGASVPGGSGASTLGSGGSTSRTGIDTGTTQSTTPDVAIPNATLPNVNQPGTGIDGGVAPRSSGSIPNSLNGNGAGVPGSTSTGPASGGSSAY